MVCRSILSSLIRAQFFDLSSSSSSPRAEGPKQTCRRPRHPPVPRDPKPRRAVAYVSPSRVSRHRDRTSNALTPRPPPGAAAAARRARGRARRTSTSTARCENTHFSIRNSTDPAKTSDRTTSDSRDEPHIKDRPLFATRRATARSVCCLRTRSRGCAA